MPRLILDVMGGDHPPRAKLEGAVAALKELRGELCLIGDESSIRAHLDETDLKPLREELSSGKIRIVHSTESIAMDDSIRSIRGKPGASINIGCRMAAEDWKAWKAGKLDAPSGFISAGHSGAVMASALLAMGRLASVERPAIAIKLPTLSPHGCVFLDAGANVECKPEHLRDFAVMGALYAQVGRPANTRPKVAVLSNGEEPTKGTDLTRMASAMIAGASCFAGRESIGEFLGYAEGKEIFKGVVDVVVTDGFTGNVVLKSLEGLGSTLVQYLSTEIRKNPVTLLGGMLVMGVLRRVKRKLDYAEYGAAPLLGVNGYAFVCHGRSDARAIKNAILRAQSAVSENFLARMESALPEAAGI